MSGSLNCVQLIGNLGADPDVRRTQDGRPVVNIRMATSQRWRDKATGEQKEQTEWHRVVIFNEALCKVAEEYLEKGAKIFVMGSLQTRKWTDKDNIERYSTEIVLGAFNSQLIMLDRAQPGAGPSPEDYGKTQTRAPASNGAGAAGGKRGDMDDEIPF